MPRTGVIGLGLFRDEGSDATPFLLAENGLAPFANGLLALCELDWDTKSAMLRGEEERRGEKRGDEMRVRRETACQQIGSR